jgi:branched-chain amino acid transport system permease protein
VLRAYAIALAPALVMTAGAIYLVEMSYRMSTQPELGTRMRLFWVNVDAATPWPWLAAVVMIAAGFIVFRKTWPIVVTAWQQSAAEPRIPGGAR